MTREELQALIDRVIGKKGILRAPSWWVRRLFGNLMDYTDNAVKNVKVEVDSEMSDESENAVSNKVIKAYVDTAIGDIDTILDNINGEVK